MLDQLELVLGKHAPGRPPHQIERAGDFPIENEGQNQAGLVREPPEQLVAEAGIPRDILGQYRPPLLPQTWPATKSVSALRAVLSPLNVQSHDCASRSNRSGSSR